MEKDILDYTLSYVGREIASKKEITFEDLKKFVRARYVNESGTIYLEKIIDDHVVEKVRIGDIEWWKRVKRYQTALRFKPTTDIKYIGCPLSCGLCPVHQNATALLNIVVTNRCNLNCFYCFFYSERAGYVYEPSLKEIREMIRSAKKYNNGKLYAVQLTGGEPTLREDLDEIIRLAKEEGVKHIQLNTNAVRIGIMYFNNPEKAVNYVKKLRKVGLNTIYMSFDALSPKNFKNYYETPFALEAFLRGNLRSVVLVPTLINGFNFPDEVGKIVIFAGMHPEVIRGVNFQPVSFVGFMRKEEIERIEKERVTQSDLEIALKQQLGIPREAWRPVPFVVPLLILLGKEDLGFYNNPLCGEATYVIVEREKNKIKFHPITDFIDIDKFYNDTKDVINKGFIGRILLKSKIAYKLLTGRYIINDELPSGERLSKLLKDLVFKKDYRSAGKLHYNLLFLGTMHFMDPFNYDIKRVMRCSIHYASPDGRVIPFCTYNVFPSVYRDSILRKYSLPESEARKKLEENKIFYKEVREFRNRKKEIMDHPIFKKWYNL